MILRLIAGGERAIRTAVEGAEDSLTEPITDLTSLRPSFNPKLDSVIGLTASGRTPYVLAGLRYAREEGAFTGGICCASSSELAEVVEVVVECEVEGEVITGSSRMKSATAQKMVSFPLCQCQGEEAWLASRGYDGRERWARRVRFLADIMV